VRRAVAVAGGRVGRLVAVRRRVDLRVGLRQRRVALRGLGDAAVELVAQLVGVVFGVVSPVAAVTPATPARPTIFQGTFMGA